MMLGVIVVCLIMMHSVVGLYKLLWSVDQRPLERRRTELNETAVFRTVLERFRTDLTTFDAIMVE